MHGSAARGIAIPFTPLPSFLRSPPPSQALRFSALLAASFNPLPPAGRLTPSVIPSQVSIHFLCLSIPLSPFATLPHRDSADTRTRRSGHTANRKLNSQQRARRAWFQLRGARGTKLNDRDVFRLLRRRSYTVDIEGQNGTGRKKKRERERKERCIYLYILELL